MIKDNPHDHLAIDGSRLNALRVATEQSTPESIKKAAHEFEALFLGMMLKSMRESMPGDSLFGGEHNKMLVSMLDEQMSQQMAGHGLGLAEALEKQLLGAANQQYQKARQENQAPVVPQSTEKSIPVNLPHSQQKAHVQAFEGRLSQHAEQASEIPANLPRSQKKAHVQAFEDRLSHHAEQVSEITGIPAKFMLAQAALETGWGKREIVSANGQPSYNVFGIKAGKNWKGNVVNVMTTEYENGVAVKKKASFRAYQNYAEAFHDYANLIKTNPRYKNALENLDNAAGFAKKLQQAGYATDPNYANKLINVMTYSLSV